MKPLGAHLGLGLVLGWLMFQLLNLWTSAFMSVGFGVIVGIIFSFGFTRSTVIGGAVALLAPFGVMLPALVLADMARALGYDIPGFSWWELAVFLALYTAFLCSAFGVIQVDIYRLGYAPLPVAGMVLAICLYGLLSGNWLMSLVAVLGQVLWAARWGSSNWFDYLLHVSLWPVALISLILAVF